MLFLTISTTANSNSVIIEELHNSISIVINKLNEPSMTVVFKFATPKELYSFDIENAVNEILWEEFSEDFCTASVTVTVSVGYNSTYATATVSVNNVPCNEIAATIKRLKNELKAALK